MQSLQRKGVNITTHIVHILKHGSFIGVDRGCLVCTLPDKTEKRLPLCDILAVIIAARGVSFSGESFARLIENNAVIMHCDSSYKPIGYSIGLHRIVHNEIFETQMNMPPYFRAALWNIILRAKSENQACLLDALCKEHKIWRYLDKSELAEGNIARHYWKIFFKSFGRNAPKKREYQNAQSPINGMLNYCYAVMSALLHRSILIHGLSPVLGIYHRYRFRSAPLVYDLIEPLRPFCDYILLRYHKNNPRMKIETFVKHCAKDLLKARIDISSARKLSLPAAVDFYVSSISKAYKYGDTKYIKLPSLKGVSFEE